MLEDLRIRQMGYREELLKKFIAFFTVIAYYIDKQECLLDLSALLL